MKGLLLSIFVFFGFGLYAQSEKDMLEKAKSLLEEKDTVKAIHEYVNILTRYPQSLQATVGLADIYEGQRDYKTAIQYINVSLDVIDNRINDFPNYAFERDKAVLFYMKGKVRNKQGRHEDALDALETALEFNPAFVDAYIEQSRTYFVMNDFPAAESVLRKGLYKFPEEWKVVYNLGVLLMSVEATDSAMAYLYKAVEINPDLPAPYFFLGQHSFENGDYVQAIDYYSFYLNAYPESLQVLYNRATCYMNTEDFYAAISDWSRFLKQDKDNAEVYRNRGMARMHLNDLEEAIEDFDTSIKLNPKSNYAYVNRGFSNYLLRNYGQALNDFQKVNSLYPEYTYGYYYKALVYQKQRKKRKACENLKIAISHGFEENNIDEDLKKMCGL